jgi:hypothetical protein
MDIFEIWPPLGTLKKHNFEHVNQVYTVLQRADAWATAAYRSDYLAGGLEAGFSHQEPGGAPCASDEKLQLQCCNKNQVLPEKAIISAVFVLMARSRRPAGRLLVKPNLQTPCEGTRAVCGVRQAV